MAEPLSTDELFERLERRVLGPEGQGHRAFLLPEVQIENRRADAMAVGLWDSRGQLVEGFELKSNREDWLREYEDHQKAEPCMAMCDHFWLVTNPGVVEMRELPPKWGLLLSAGRRRHLVVAKEAPTLREDVSHPVSREVIAGFLRRVQIIGVEDREAIRKAGYENGRASVEHDHEDLEVRLERAEREARQHDEAYQAFLDKAGMGFWSWRPTAEHLALFGEIAAAIKEGERGIGRILSDLEQGQKLATNVADRLRSAVSKIGDHKVDQSDVF